MEMEQWMKCNLCFSGLSTNSSFWLTSCGHLFCKKCLDSGGKQCSFCKESNISSLPLTNLVRSEVKYIFKPIEDSFEKWRTAFSFQNTQSKIVLNRLLLIERKYNFMKTNYLRIVEENNRLRENLKTATEKFKEVFITSALQGYLPGTTPVSTPVSRKNNVKNVDYKTVFENQVQNDGLANQTPANQRLQTLKLAPVKIRKQKARKRVGQNN